MSSVLARCMLTETLWGKYIELLTKHWQYDKNYFNEKEILTKYCTLINLGKNLIQKWKKGEDII